MKNEKVILKFHQFSFFYFSFSKTRILNFSFIEKQKLTKNNFEFIGITLVGFVFYLERPSGLLIFPFFDFRIY